MPGEYRREGAVVGVPCTARDLSDLEVRSRKRAVDYDRLLTGQPQLRSAAPELGGPTFQLFRIGDAVAARNTHAAIYDALRLVKDL